MNEITTQLANRDLDRIRGCKELLNFYHGEQWEGRATRGEKRLTFNYARVFIDKVTSYLMSGIHFAVDPLEDSEEARAKAQNAEATLYQVYQDNNLEQLDFETEIDCAILGDACYKIIWDAETKRVRITAPDIQGIYTWSFGDDTSRVWRVASKYNLSAEETELLYKIKPSGKTATIVEVWTDSEFELYLDNAPIEKKPNPYGFIPFVIYPNLREPKKFWGISDLPQIREPQRELNRALSQLSRILELSGNPIAVLENVEESEDIAVRPGAVWNIPEEAKAYLLDL
ncbi:MAG: phage portal protein, partial [Chloroflexi bacterium]|nr:phage portal protein [Chloroflexota bacterium]